MDNDASTVHSHLEATYGIRVTGISTLDLGVFKVDRADGQPWVARHFPAARTAQSVAGDAQILQQLADHDFPAERCAGPDPVSALGGAQLLVTEHIQEVPRAHRQDTIRSLGGFRTLGGMLGKLHTLPIDGSVTSRPGGAWHHLAEGNPRQEIEAAASMLAQAEDLASPRTRDTYTALRTEVENFDAGEGLPLALVHPDFVLSNVIASRDQGLVVVDWTGAGRGPRMWSLAFLLFTAGARGLRRVDSVVAGYTRHVELEAEELSRLAALVRVRPTILQMWACCHGQRSLTDTAHGMAEVNELATAIAARALEAFQENRVVSTSVSAPGTDQLPLPTLLSQLLVAFTIEFDDEFEHQMPHRTTRHGTTPADFRPPWLVSMVMWANCLRFVPEEGIAAGLLARRAHLTDKSMQGLLTRLGQWWGYLVVAPDPADTRSKPARSRWLVHPTQAGRQAQTVWAPLAGAIEDRWRTRFGSDTVEHLRAALAAIVSRLDVEFPDYLPVGDPRLEPRLPDPVAGHDSSMQLTSLLSKVLAAFALEFQRESDLSLGIYTAGRPSRLAISANLLRVLGEQPVAVRDLPARTGVAKMAIDNWLRILQERGYLIVGPDPTLARAKLVWLTPIGLDAQRTYWRWLDAVEGRWEQRFGTEVVRALRAVVGQLAGTGPPAESPLFDGLERYPDGWRTATAGREVLPHFPIVSGRGGFPDGS